MADWRARGYVQDSDEEEDSQNSIQIGLTESKETAHVDETGAIESGEPHNVEACNGEGQDKRRDLQVESEQKGTNITNAGEESSSSATLRVQREKEIALSPAVGHDGYDTEKVTVDIYEDIDELQQDHYRAAPATQLEAELPNGARDLGARPHSSPVPSNELSFPSSLSSSPLPEVFNTNRGTPSTPGTQRSARGDQSDDRESSIDGGPNALESTQHKFANQPEPLVANQAHGSRRGTRNLRHRNPIQLHPYVLESEQYRQTLKARGVKPLRIAQIEAEAAKARGQDSENLEFNSEDSQLLGSDAEQGEPQSSSPPHAHDSLPDAPQDKRDVFFFGDDDLPDMNTLLSHSKLGHVGNGYKRRKTTNAKSTAFRMPPGLELDRRTSLPGDKASLIFDDDDVAMFDMQPSPPHSGGQTPRDVGRPALPVFRVPRRCSPAPFPTPVTSSEPKRQHLDEIYEDEQSDTQSHRIRRTTDADDSTDADISLSEEDTSHQFQRAQRKIRGVLPASWLKLDLKTQKKKPEDTHRALPSASPEKEIAQRGVARAVVVTGSKIPGVPNQRHEITVLSYDEGPESETDVRPQQTRIGQNKHHTREDGGGEGLLTGRWGEAIEDDRIDAMLPSARRAFQSRKIRKRQTKIGDLHSRTRVTAQGTSKRASSNGTYQRKNMGQVDTGHKRKPKYRPPRLGILDAPLTKGSPQSLVPQFLKVASRTARSRCDQGRHSPSRKFVRLATMDDDNDANEMLRDWREGAIIPSANDEINEVSGRQPLYPRSANSPVPSRTSEMIRSLKDSKMSTSRTTSVKQHSRYAKSRKLQTSLDHLIERRHKDAPDLTQGQAPSWLQQNIEKPKTRGQLVSSLRVIKDSRPAMLESTREDADRTHAQTMFHRDLARVNHFDDDSGLPGVVVRRFFGEDSLRSSNAAAPHADREVVGQDATNVHATTKSAIPHKRRKRQPRHVNVPETWSREPSAPVIVDDCRDQAVHSFEAHRRDTLIGLGPFGTRYSHTFDVTPLPIGTCFSAKTLLGSGAFAKALRHQMNANLESSRGYALLKFKDRSLRWGPWNDAVSSELGEVFETISQSAQNVVGQSLGIPTYEQILLLQNSTLEYFSSHLSFLDPVDRAACVLRCKGLLSTLIVELIDHDAVSRKTDHQASQNSQRDLQISSLTLLFANQLCQISKHELVPSRLQDEVGSLVQIAAHRTLELSLTKGFEPFETCSSKLRNHNTDYRIHDHSIEAFVVAQHVLGQNPNSKTSVWLTLLKTLPTKSTDGVFDIALAEQSWKQLFTLLPFFELDAQGVVETGRRFKIPFDNWTLAKRLINPVLEASLSSPQGQPPNFNSYCRAVFGRCLHLMNGWGWRRCESIIGMFFDYFARNSLAHLRSEESKGSPQFLESLDQNPTLISEPEDRCFHILLKIIGTGIKHMRQTYPEKKIRDVVWRLMPNHGRSHPKEEAIRQEHLDALRNHHDLLCTLYWASPPSCRPRLTVIRNLVNLETSHREACHINIRAWFNLVKFQLSTDEPISSLEPLAEWHRDLLKQILRQHTLARTEAEDQVRSAQSDGSFTVSKELLESTIVRNQRQVEAILSDALVCLKLALDAAQNSHAASILLSTTLAKVFELFDANRIQANKPIMQALNVLNACAIKCLGSRVENEDSQDYGDWSAFEDDASAIPVQEDNASPITKFQDPLRHLLSNCFGADLVPDDALLLKVVDVWVIVAQVLVRTGLRSWADYLGHFGNDSWSSLRDTEQTRKYSAYYLATLIERDGKTYHDHKAFFLISWVCSLVERESLLKNQHRLTSALLNIDSENLLLQNLPFWKNATNGKYQIATSDFSDRRLSLISSVLSNMRVSLESAVFEPSVNGNELRQEFKDLLKHLMATMKRNYQELGHGSNARGSYVDFVHRVIELLQQHTSTIFPIDRFFTDNGAFPLPATDPTYVVAQLKNYGLRLQDARTPKQLAVFLQSVSERAAIDGQQPYLVGQLHTAMSNAFEDGVSTTPTLRTFLVKNIIPAYVEMAFSTACGWVLAMPYLQALQEVFGELLNDLDGANAGSVAAIANTIAAFLDSVRHSLEILMSHSGESTSRDAKTLRTMSACYSAITALLPVLDYIVRLPGRTLLAVDNIEFFKSLAVYFSTVLRSDGDGDMPDIDHTEKTLAETSVSDIRRFAAQELRDTLTRFWVRHDDQYYVIRGSTRREVVLDIGLYEEEKAQILNGFLEFMKVCRAMPALREEDDHILVKRVKRLLRADELLL